MRHYMGCDTHKKYSVFVGVGEVWEIISGAASGAWQRRLALLFKGLPPVSQIAVESVGNRYWLIDEIKEAGHIPALVNAGKAKLVMGNINKTDKSDARGLDVLSIN